MFTLYENPIIENILQANEGQVFDRKGARINEISLTEAIIGFANADGGVIAVGIEKDKTISGIVDWEACTGIIRKMGSVFISPPIPIRIKPFACENHKKEKTSILLIEIPQGVEVHSNSKDEVFLRIGKETMKLNHEQRMLLLDNKGNKSFELQEASGATLEDINENLISEYKDAIKIPSISSEELLTGRDLAKVTNGVLIINMASILLFGKKPERWVERARIRILKYEGNLEGSGERYNVTKDIIINGGLPKQIRETQQLLESMLREFTILDRTGKFITEPEYPASAYQEAIVNAVVHRSYAMRGADVQIKMFNDHLEIISPGRFPGLVNEENIKDTHYSRNPRIARVITELGFVKELGEGVNRIFQAIMDLDLPAPTFKEHSLSQVIVEFKNNVETRRVRADVREISENLDEEVLNSLTPEEKQIILFVSEHGKITTKECVSLINKKKLTALRRLKTLVSKEMLQVNLPNSSKSNYTLGKKFIKIREEVMDTKESGSQGSLFSE